MYVFSRKKTEQIVIGDDIFVTVVEIRGDKVRLGIELPREVPVHRKEVYDALRQDAATSQPAGAIPPSPPVTVAAPPPADQVARLAAALESRLGVAVSREVVARAMQEAGIEEPERNGA